MRLEIDAFSSIKYIGVQTQNPPTNYSPFFEAIQNELDNTTVRSARKPHLVYNTLKTLNDKFSGEIENVSNILFPDQYFTCPVKCLSCFGRCQNSMGHLLEGKPHCSNNRCLKWQIVYFLICIFFFFFEKEKYWRFDFFSDVGTNTSLKIWFTSAKNVTVMVTRSLWPAARKHKTQTLGMVWHSMPGRDTSSSVPTAARFIEVASIGTAIKVLKMTQSGLK